MCKNNAPPVDDLAALQKLSPQQAKAIACTIFGLVTGYKYLPLAVLATLLRRWRRGANLWSGMGMKIGMLLSLMSLRRTLHLWRSTPSNVFSPPFLEVIMLRVQTLCEGRVNDSFVEIMQKHGTDTYHIQAPGMGNIIVTGDPAIVEHFLKTNFENYEKGHDFHERLEELLGNGIFNTDGDMWYGQRKLASRLFTTNNFKTHMWLTFTKHANLLAGLIDRAAGTGELMDMFALFNRFTLDSIGEVGFGRNIGSLESPDNPVLKSFDTAQIYAAQRLNTRELTWKLDKLLGHQAEKGLSSHCKALDAYSRQIAREAWQLHVDGSGSATASKRRAHQGDFLSLFIQEMRNANPTGDTGLSERDEQYLRDVIMNFLIAGRDTTAQALSWTFLLLSQNPEVEAKLQQELQSAFGGKEPDYESVNELQYAQAVVHEALRLYPSVPKNIKVAINRDVLPNGIVVPAGCSIAHIPFMMGRMRSIWGEDAAQFRPERWLGQEQMNLYKYPVFHAGPRECLGRRMALLEMKVALAYLLPKYKFKLAVSPNDIKYADSLTMPMSTPLLMAAERR